MIGHQLAEVFDNPKIVFVHNYFPPSSTAFKLGNIKSLAVGASTVIRL
jgi:hypothetical protein